MATTPEGRAPGRRSSLAALSRGASGCRRRPPTRSPSSSRPATSIRTPWPSSGSTSTRPSRRFRRPSWSAPLRRRPASSLCSTAARRTGLLRLVSVFLSASSSPRTARRSSSNPAPSCREATLSPSSFAPAASRSGTRRGRCPRPSSTRTTLPGASLSPRVRSATGRSVASAPAGRVSRSATRTRRATSRRWVTSSWPERRRAASWSSTPRTSRGSRAPRRGPSLSRTSCRATCARSRRTGTGASSSRRSSAGRGPAGRRIGHRRALAVPLSGGTA